jgi:hypothetical protein
MMFKNYNRHYEVYRDISAVWDEIRSFAEASSISKIDKDTWGFTFSYCKDRYSSLSLPVTTGKASSKGDNLTVIDITSNSFISGSLSIIGFVAMIILINSIKSRTLNIFIKVLLVLGFIFGLVFLHNRETKANICELEQRLKQLESVVK